MNKTTQQKDKYQEMIKKIKEKSYKKIIIYAITGGILTFLGGMTWLYLITEEQNFKGNQEIIAIIISLIIFAIGIHLIKKIRILKYDLKRKIEKVEEIKISDTLNKKTE